MNSYTVYQNVELILQCQRLQKSGNQTEGAGDFKTRRAFQIRENQSLQAVRRAKAAGRHRQGFHAKDTAIVVADEPTGNLDSKSAEGIVKLLSEIARDKLVIVVTHNYEQFEAYATRKIKMHDGKVVEDEILEENGAGAGGGKTPASRGNAFRCQ